MTMGFFVERFCTLFVICFLVSLFVGCDKEDTSWMSKYDIDTLSVEKQMEKNENREYIEVETKPQFGRFGYEHYEVIKDGIYIFPTGEEILFSINMKTSLIKEKLKGVKRKFRSSELLIPVEVSVSKGINVICNHVVGMSDEIMQVTSSEDGHEEIFKFYIKNDPNIHPSIGFMFNTLKEDDAVISVTFGNALYKIVNKSCDVSYKMHFSK